MLPISSFTADLIGFGGSALIVAAYAYSNMTARMNLLLFNVLNFIGAALLAVSLTVNYNLPTMVLEIVWMAIALFGIIKALRTARPPPLQGRGLGEGDKGNASHSPRPPTPSPKGVGEL